MSHFLFAENFAHDTTGRAWKAVADKLADNRALTLFQTLFAKVEGGSTSVRSCPNAHTKACRW
eukprot:6362543-Prorocentrum_lima.AAC.1